MVNIRLSGLLNKGKIVEEQLIRILQRHEDAIENGGEDSSVLEEVSSIKQVIGDESTEGTILARIKALEDA